jgi:hypothetical protein
VTTLLGFARIQTDENGLAADFERCKLLMLGGFPLELSHNAGVEGSSPSLSTNEINGLEFYCWFALSW